MLKTLLLAAALTIAQPLFAQEGERVPAPADVSLDLGIEGGPEFHLGELIPIKFSYRASVPGRYFWAGNGTKLAGGSPLDISCSPEAERLHQKPPSHDGITFSQMLIGSCGIGIGGGVGGGCIDCGGDVRLTTQPLTFGIVPLNTYVRFRAPGTYSCQASSAEVTATPRTEKIRAALLVKSKPIVITLVEDPNWAHTAAAEYATAYEKFCRGDDVVEKRTLQCFDITRRINYLDTVDSLATEVKEFDGRNHGWDNGFWEGIQGSSHPREALQRMAARIQDPDFQVSTNTLEWLAMSEVKMDVPGAFQSDTPAKYHAEAIEKLRKYVRLLGNSLQKKNPDVLPESAKTYRSFAEQEYCGGDPPHLKGRAVPGLGDASLIRTGAMPPLFRPLNSSRKVCAQIKCTPITASHRKDCPNIFGFEGESFSEIVGSPS